MRSRIARRRRLLYQVWGGGLSCSKCGFPVGPAALRCPECGASLGRSRRKRRRPPRVDSIRKKFSEPEVAPAPFTPRAAEPEETDGCFGFFKSGVLFVVKVVLFLIVLVLASQMHDCAKKARNDAIFRKNSERWMKPTRRPVPTRTRTLNERQRSPAGRRHRGG